MDRLDELEILVAIAETGSLIAAARRLGRSPPSVTRGLASLESRVGLRLVERTTRRLAVTEAGRDLAEHGRRVLSEYEASLDASAVARLHGLLRVTAPLVFGRRHVTPIVTSFLQQHPGIDIELVLHDRDLDLIEERLHLGLRIGSLKDSSLVARRVGTVRRLLVASPDYLTRRGTPISPDDLTAHDTILVTGVSSTEEWALGSGERRRSVRIAPRLRVNEVEAALVAVRAGRGIARVLSYQIFDELAEGRLVRILQDCEPDALLVQLAVPHARAMAPKVRAFFDHAVQCLESLPQIRSN